MMRLASLALALSAALAGCSLPGDPAPSDDPASTSPSPTLPPAPQPPAVLRALDWCQVAEAGDLVARNAQELEAAWDVLCEGEPPAADFANETVLGIFAGEKPSTGYSVNITSMSTDGSTLLVRALLKVPGDDCVTGSALTHPALVVAVERTQDAVVFELSESRYSCEAAGQPA